MIFAKFSYMKEDDNKVKASPSPCKKKIKKQKHTFWFWTLVNKNETLLDTAKQKV